jgi:hypothetical protein
MKISKTGIKTQISTLVFMLTPLCGGAFCQSAYAQGMPATTQSNAAAQVLVEMVTGGADNPLNVSEEVSIDSQSQGDIEPSATKPMVETRPKQRQDLVRPDQAENKPDAFSLPNKSESNSSNDPARNIARFTRLEAQADSDFSAYDSIEAGEIFRVPAGMLGAGSHVMLFRGVKRDQEGKYRSVVGLLRSTDNGVSWEKLGEVVEAEKAGTSGLTNR